VSAKIVDFRWGQRADAVSGTCVICTQTTASQVFLITIGNVILRSPHLCSFCYEGIQRLGAPGARAGGQAEDTDLSIDVRRCYVMERATPTGAFRCTGQTCEPHPEKQGAL
jgi:hypothetical protein